MPEDLITVLVFLSLLAVALLILYLSIFISRRIMRKIAGAVFRKSKDRWDVLLIRNNLFVTLGHLVALIVLKQAVPVLFEDWPKTLTFFEKVLDVYFVFILIQIIISILRASEERLAETGLFIEKPIASYFQLFRIILYIVGFILALSILLSKSPVYFLGAFGAMTAVILLIFKDTILGLVASILISANDMIRIGDWVEMPKFNADGDVIAINLNTVKVSNWDKTITTVPTHYFISESFKNWRGMQKSGGRRIRRNLLININSIKFVDAEMRKKFKKIDLISDFIDQRQQEIEDFNLNQGFDKDVLINGRRMTNIGVFRNYIDHYLRNHPGVNQNMSLMVRQQPPTEHGLPLQVYCFTKSVKWVEYETVQSDIFDHLFAAASYFDITIYQSPAGEDLRMMGK